MLPQGFSYLLGFRHEYVDRISSLTWKKKEFLSLHIHALPSPALPGSWDPLSNPLNQKLWAVPSNVFNQPMGGSDAPRLLAYLLRPDYYDLTACFYHFKSITQNPPGLTSFYKIRVIMVPALLRLIWLLFCWCDKIHSRNNLIGERFLVALDFQESSVHDGRRGHKSRGGPEAQEQMVWARHRWGCRDHSYRTSKCSPQVPTYLLKAPLPSK